jgi:hypothetical protein
MCASVWTISEAMEEDVGLLRLIDGEKGRGLDWREGTEVSRFLSHLSVSHGGLGGGVPVSGGRVGPVLWWGLPISRLVEGLLGQRGHRHQGVGLVLFVHLERLRQSDTLGVLAVGLQVISSHQ